MRRAEADEGRHEVDSAAPDRRRRRARPLSARVLDQPEPVAQPLHRGAGDEDRALQRIGALAAELVGDGGQQPVLRGDRRIAGVQQGEAAGAIGRFHHARPEAGLADGRRLLVAGDAADRDGAAEQDARWCRTRRRSRAPPAASAVGTRCSAHIVVHQAPALMSKSSVREALVASVAWTRPPVRRQSRKLSTVPKASSPRSARLARAGDVVEQPGDLGAGEIGVEQQAGGGGDRLGMPGLAQRGAGGGRAAVLPDDGAVDRPAAAAVPDQRRLPLVGDADAGDVLRPEPGLRPSPPASPRARSQRSSGSCSTQPEAG